MKIKYKDLECEHHKRSGDGFHYKLINGMLWICDKCEKKLRKGIVAQQEIERNMFYKRD